MIEETVKVLLAQVEPHGTDTSKWKLVKVLSLFISVTDIVVIVTYAYLRLGYR